MSNVSCAVGCEPITLSRLELIRHGSGHTASGVRPGRFAASTYARPGNTPPLSMLVVEVPELVPRHDPSRGGIPWTLPSFHSHSGPQDAVHVGVRQPVRGAAIYSTSSGLTARLKQWIAVAPDTGAVQGKLDHAPLEIFTVASSMSGGHRGSVADGLVVLAGDPEAVQQHGELPGNGDDRLLLRCFPSALREAQPPAP